MGCFSRIKTSDTETEIVRSDSGSNTTWITNETEKTLVFRDKYRQQFGRLRHTVAPYSLKKIEVDVAGTDTYYQMGVLVRGESNPTSTAAAGEEGNTQLCIDTDDLMVYSKIIVSYSEDKFSVKKVRRNRDPAL